jgi:hypothetical protein
MLFRGCPPTGRTILRPVRVDPRWQSLHRRVLAGSRQAGDLLHLTVFFHHEIFWMESGNGLALLIRHHDIHQDHVGADADSRRWDLGRRGRCGLTPASKCHAPCKQQTQIWRAQAQKLCGHGCSSLARLVRAHVIIFRLSLEGVCCVLVG